MSFTPRNIVTWSDKFAQGKVKYLNNELSFITGLLPEIAINLSAIEILEILHRKLGTDKLTEALNPNLTVESPAAALPNTNWMKTTNMVGINPRTITNFFNIVKYVLTIPASQDSLHLLPIWEPGVVSSLYGKVSWNINPEFYSVELQNAVPSLDTVEKQLKVTVNLLHALGKKVGMDVIPHTDRFSEMTLTFPRFFEWVKRKSGTIESYDNDLYKEIEQIIWLFLTENGTADNQEITFIKDDFFDPENNNIDDQIRQFILFGPESQYEGRLERRLQIMQKIIDSGFETLPMTMAPPYRGLHINSKEYILDKKGNRWYTYEFDQPEGMSRVFGPLTRYKFFPSKPGSWELNFDKPNLPLWQYLANRYLACRDKYNLDFMRGDMAHVQPRASGVPTVLPEYYDPLAYIKSYIQKTGLPYFAFYAETFLAEPDTMGYGNECEHLNAINADATLGDIQSSVPGSQDFRTKFDKYRKLLKTENFAPCYTIITSDKDDPRFDEFYQEGNIMRLFTGLFLTDMPSYMSLGFETRNQHLQRGKNEEYTKLYVFKIEDESEKDKYTKGAFEWGKDFEKFNEIENLRIFYENIYPEIADSIPVMLTNAQFPSEFIIWQINSFYFISCLNPEMEINKSTIPIKLILENCDKVYEYNGKYACAVFQKSK